MYHYRATAQTYMSLFDRTQKAKSQSFTVPASSLSAVLQLKVFHRRSQSVVYAHRYNGDRMQFGQLFGHCGDITTVYHGHLHEGTQPEHTRLSR